MGNIDAFKSRRRKPLKLQKNKFLSGSKKMLNEIKKSILSGIMISVGGTVYLSCVSQNLSWLGAFLFSAGLYTICQYGFNLYTGKVGYIALHFKDYKYTGLVILILTFNLLTTYILGLLLKNVFPQIVEPAKNIFSAKLEKSFIQLFVSGIYCGLLMFLAVDTWKNGSKIGCFIFIPVFILSGFDHSVANSFYNGVANGLSDAFTVKNLMIFVSVILGNALGGMIIPLLNRTWKKS